MAIKRILITGAGGSAGANFIKSLRLADEKFYLVGTDTNKYHLELVDGLDKKYLLPPATDVSYIEKLNKIIDLEKIEFVHPQPDIEVAILGFNRKKLTANTLLPTNETIRLCQNKIKCNNQLSKKKIPIPLSYHLKDKKGLSECLNILLKDNEKAWLRAISGAGSKASLPIEDLEQGHQWINYWITMRNLKYSDFMISEFLPGKEFAFQSIWKNGKLITSQARERIAYVFGNLTPSGQSSSPSVAKTVHQDSVNKTATDAIKAIDNYATGIFCVDMKENKYGVPCVTEINCGRFFTTNDFFSVAGSNMPYYYIKMAYKEELPLLPEYNAIPEGYYWIRMIDMGQKIIKGEEWSCIEI